MKQSPLPPDLLFKGIALFTPGGDLVYCIDTQKRGRWHLNLCATIQEVLGLAEPPHFLVPSYTATLDRWRDPKSQQIITTTEASPLVLQHQALLNSVFSLGNWTWTPNSSSLKAYDLAFLDHFRAKFSQLWDCHELIIRVDDESHQLIPAPEGVLASMPLPTREASQAQGYVLRLFISGQGKATEHILKNLYEILERSLHEPYTLKVVDVSKNPDQAEADQISAIPTLMKVWPPPVRKIVGDLHNVERLLNLLISPDPNPAPVDD